MPPAIALTTATASLTLAIGVTAVAALLAWRQRRDRRRREPSPSEDDARYYARQDSRRSLIGIVMVLLALGVAAASGLEPRVGGRTNAQFVAVWLAVCFLILFLLWLALMDWVATWSYARRHRRALAMEREEFFRLELRRLVRRGDDRGTPGDPPDGHRHP